MAVITIAREYGAGGSAVAELLARRLGATVVDRSLIADVARRAAAPPEEVAAEDERAPSFLDRLVRGFLPFGDTIGGWATSRDDLLDRHARIVAFTRAAIQESARLGNAIIVGRGGAAALRDHPGVLHVYLWAPEADRVRTVSERQGCDEAAARRAIRTVDARRATFVREAYDVDWRDRSLYDLALNTGRLGREGAAAAILGVLGARHTEGVASPSQWVATS